jgi:hypothetical protein
LPVPPQRPSFLLDPGAQSPVNRAAARPDNRNAAKAHIQLNKNTVFIIIFNILKYTSNYISYYGFCRAKLLLCTKGRAGGGFYSACIHSYHVSISSWHQIAVGTGVNATLMRN